jgi:hypothetical protein
MQQMENFAAQLQSNPPAQKRLALLRRLDKVTGASELLIRMEIANFRCIFKTINRVLPPEKRLEEAKMEQLCNVRKVQSGPRLKNRTLAGFLYTYRSISDAELTKYIDFCESDVGQWFNRISGGATMKAMAIAAEEVGRQMAKLLLEQ